MARQKFDFNSGTLGAALPASSPGSAGTITFAASSLPTYSLVSGDYVALTIEPPQPGQPAGNAEIVYHNGPYTAGTSTGAITRGEEGTNAPAHASGAIWTHDPTVVDFVAISLNTSAANIASSAPGDAANAGTVGTAADAGHKHAREGWGGSSNIMAIAAAATAGASGKVADAAHVHPGLGLPLALAGATATTRFAGATASGPPNSGTFQLGDFVVDQSGTFWICTVAGTPGTWLNPAASGGVQTITAGVNVVLTGTAQNPVVNAAESDPTIPSGYWYQTWPRLSGVSSAVLSFLSSGQISFLAVSLIAGDVVSKIAFMSGSTAAGSPTHQWFALLDSSFNMLCATVDGTSTAWPANALQPLAIGWVYSGGAWSSATSYTVPNSGLYYLAIMVTATTVPTLSGSATNNALANLTPPIAGQDTTHTGQTTPNSAPATLVSAGTPGGYPFALIG